MLDMVVYCMKVFDKGQHDDLNEREDATLRAKVTAKKARELYK